MIVRELWQWERLGTDFHDVVAYLDRSAGVRLLVDRYPEDISCQGKDCGSFQKSNLVLSDARGSFRKSNLALSEVCRSKRQK